MKDPSRTTQELLEEISALKQRIRELEQSESEHKRAEEALRISAEKYRILFEFFPLGISITDDKGNIIESNAEVGNLFRKIRRQSRRKTIFDPDLKTIRPDGSAKPVDEYPSVVALRENRPVPGVEVGIDTGGGEIAWLSVTAAPIPLEGHGVVIAYKDIAERKRVEEALRDSEERFSIAFRVNPAPMVISTLDDGVVLDANDRFLSMMGYTRNEMVGKESAKLPIWVDYDARTAFIRKFFKEGSLRGESVRVRAKNGEIRDTLWSAEAIRYKGREVVLSLLYDITERKRAEEALRESEEKYRTIVENLNDAMFIHDFEGNILDVNENACRMLGYERNEIVGVSLAKIDEKWRQPVNPELERLIQEGHLIFERENIRKDGSVVSVEVSVRIVRRGGKDLIQGFVRDITDRKRLEKALRENEARFRLIAENMSDMIRLTDVHGTNIYVSPSHEKYLGYRPEERTGRHVMELVHPDDIEKVLRVFSRSLKTQSPLKTEYRIRHADGRYIWLETIGDIIYDENGRPQGGIFSSRDVTDRKRLTGEIEKSREQLRLLAAKLESSREDERTALAREIHDELGQSLTALKMDLAWLTKKLPKEQTELLDKARSMQKLLDGNVKLARDITTRLRPAILDDFGLMAAIEWQASDFEHRTGIRCFVKSNVKKIKANKKLSISLFRVFQEALTNIAKHSDASCVVISLMKENSTLIMEIRDNGKGVRKSELRKKGSFGLLGIRERVSLLGGTLDIDSHTGKGTALRVSIPVK